MDINMEMPTGRSRLAGPAGFFGGFAWTRDVRRLRRLRLRRVGALRPTAAGKRSAALPCWATGPFTYIS